MLSCGHASLLQYVILYLTGYDISLDDIKNFRQWASITPGHPEYRVTPGIETTTGPLGQGFMNAVGMAIAEAHLSAVYNRPNAQIVNHYTYVFCSDGDLMEGASHEAASLAGHLKLGKLICVYDDNHISIEGPTELTLSDDVAKRFEAYHWHVQNIGDHANDLAVIKSAFVKAVANTEQPSLIILRSHIGYGAPHRHDTKEAHGEPLGEDEVRLAKQFYGWSPDEHFVVPQEVLDYTRKSMECGKAMEDRWNDLLADYKAKYPDLAAKLSAALNLDLPSDWADSIPSFTTDQGPMATRDAGSKVLNAITSKVDYLIGGSADLSPSTKTLIKDSDYFEAGKYENRNIDWGVREHVMCAASSGMALHGGIRPYVSTFFIFTDYARPAIRLACLMKLPVIYVMTHDSIGLGEDGPTHQSIEQLASLRAMPNMILIRPGDVNETAWAWRAAMLHSQGPVMLILTRQKLPVFDPAKVGSPEGLLKGAYIIVKEHRDKPDIILIATGSEVQLIIDAQPRLHEMGLDARCVSMPSWQLFEAQSPDYRDSVLPPEIKARLAVEAGATLGWYKWVGDQGDVIGIDRFGASAPGSREFQTLWFYRG